VHVELITIGDELLLGFTIDTNGAYIARELAPLGFEVVRRTTVGDEAHAITEAVQAAIERTGAVITTGGLGPTADDRTRPAIAELFGRGLTLHQDLLDAVEARFRRLGYSVMPPSNVSQAMIPEGARVLLNRHGTAPGIWLEDARGRWVVMLPGVPREMRGMLADTLIPLLQERLQDGVHPITSRTLRTTGIGESTLAERLGDLAKSVKGMPLAFLPGWEGVDLRLTARGLPSHEANAVLDQGLASLRAAAGIHVYGEGRDDLAAVVLDAARRDGLHIATAESCTGGLLGGRLTAIPGSSDVYRGGVVAYANEVKSALLGVPVSLIERHGAVSEPVAAAMAAGAAERLSSEIAMAITGVAGPGGGTADKPVGTVCMATQVRGAGRVVTRHLVGDREEIRLRSTQSALDMVRRTLSESR
jgi:nicotinamide-nucleotide amidase